MYFDVETSVDSVVLDFITSLNNSSSSSSLRTFSLWTVLLLTVLSSSSTETSSAGFFSGLDWLVSLSDLAIVNIHIKILQSCPM